MEKKREKPRENRNQKVKIVKQRIVSKGQNSRVVTRKSNANTKQKKKDKWWHEVLRMLGLEGVKLAVKIAPYVISALTGPKAAPIYRVHNKINRGSSAERCARTFRTYYDSPTPGVLRPSSEPPLPFFSSAWSKHNGTGLTLAGSDYLCQLNVESTTKAGDVLIDIPLNPYGLGAVRLRNYAANWEMWRCRTMVVVFQPTKPATEEGAILMYIDHDPDSVLLPNGGEANIRKGMSHAGNSTTQVWQQTAAVLTPYAEDAKYCDPEGDPRFTTEGRIVVLATTDFASTTSLGFLQVYYVVEFFIAQLEESGTVGSHTHMNGATSMTPTLPFGTACAPSTNGPTNFDFSGEGMDNGSYYISNSLPVQYTANTESYFFLPRGMYFVSMYIVGTGFSDFAVTANTTNVIWYDIVAGRIGTTECIAYGYMLTSGNKSGDSLKVTCTGTTVTSADISFDAVGYTRSVSSKFDVCMDKIKQLEEQVNDLSDYERKLLSHHKLSPRCKMTPIKSGRHFDPE